MRSLDAAVAISHVSEWDTNLIFEHMKAAGHCAHVSDICAHYLLIPGSGRPVNAAVMTNVGMREFDQLMLSPSLWPRQMQTALACALAFNRLDPGRPLLDWFKRTKSELLAGLFGNDATSAREDRVLRNWVALGGSPNEALLWATQAREPVLDHYVHAAIKTGELRWSLAVVAAASDPRRGNDSEPADLEIARQRQHLSIAQPAFPPMGAP